MSGRPQAPAPDITEKGAPIDGAPQTSNERLFMQFLAFGDCADTAPLIAALERAGFDAVVYEDLNDPRGVGVLTFHKDTNHFIDAVRPVLLAEPFASLTPKEEFTMFGRTYSLGYEQDLEDTLFHRPRRTVLNKDWNWVVWYPLRRSGKFETLEKDHQMSILREHGVIGMSFGGADLAHDVRLACHGIDKNDNDFVIGLIGDDLYPLSKIVQTMRTTEQTSQYLDRLGPFFVGRVKWQSEA
jgi:chlorite dismutase